MIKNKRAITIALVIIAVIIAISLLIGAMMYGYINPGYIGAAVILGILIAFWRYLPSSNQK